MKHTSTASSIGYLLLFCMVMGSIGCVKKQGSPADDDHPFSYSSRKGATAKPFQARLIASFCAYHIVQIQDSAFYSYGMNWTDAEGENFQHVFTIKNHCDFAKARVKAGENFTCSIVDKAADSHCSFCEGFLATPSLRHNIRVLK